MPHAFGRTGRVEHEALVAGFLEYREDPAVAGLALRVLCRYRGLVDRNAGRIREFLGREDGVLSPRSVAIGMAGDRLRDRRDPAMLARMLELAGGGAADRSDREHVLTEPAKALGISTRRVRGVRTVSASWSKPLPGRRREASGHWWTG